ncbi:hypothetical protein NPIL_630281 [Nephila pilipes]|uniref:Uncharacterized protein n=1 Tax=Nephila pilipes TaxID=299642 RepID=A0A8X6QFL6_NEPPI|nr:hypothetical protein NPIL_630281 [Nephila pilipes]
MLPFLAVQFVDNTDIIKLNFSSVSSLLLSMSSLPLPLLLCLLSLLPPPCSYLSSSFKFLNCGHHLQHLEITEGGIFISMLMSVGILQGHF